MCNNLRLKLSLSNYNSDSITRELTTNLLITPIILNQFSSYNLIYKLKTNYSFRKILIENINCVDFSDDPIYEKKSDYFSSAVSLSLFNFLLPSTLCGSKGIDFKYFKNIINRELINQMCYDNFKNLDLFSKKESIFIQEFNVSLLSKIKENICKNIPAKLDRAEFKSFCEF